MCKLPLNACNFKFIFIKFEVAKCPRCCGMGWGFPCPVLKNYYKECNDCNNIFRHPKCFDRHLERQICEHYKRYLAIPLTQKTFFNLDV